MPDAAKLLSPFPGNMAIATAIIFSGLCWYLSCGLSGNFGWLLWIAPVPVLLVSFYVSARKAFGISFLAYLIGRLSWVPYLLSVVPVPLTILFTTVLSLAFAIVVVLTRRIVLRSSGRVAVWAFPVFWCSFEWLGFIFSKDGTIGSIAYSQIKILPVIQIASLTGIIGITFLVTLVPSMIAVMIYYRKNKSLVFYSAGICATILVVVLSFGFIRLYSSVKAGGITTGLAAIDMNQYKDVYDTSRENEIHIAGLYLQQIEVLASQGAQVVIIPEKAIPVTDATDSVITDMFIHAAKTYHLSLVLGYSRLTRENKTNIALVISGEGKVIADYCKVNLYEGEAWEGFRQGKEVSVFSLNGIPSGVAICKDMDFDQFMRNYKLNNTGILYVPAWDFIADGWLHSRMAIMRGIENGYSIVRCAQDGRLTISNNRGKVLHEAVTARGENMNLTGLTPTGNANTIYSKGGYLSGWLIIAASLYFLLSALKRKPVTRVK